MSQNHRFRICRQFHSRKGLMVTQVIVDRKDSCASAFALYLSCTSFKEVTDNTHKHLHTVCNYVSDLLGLFLIKETTRFVPIVSWTSTAVASPHIITFLSHLSSITELKVAFHTWCSKEVSHPGTDQIQIRFPSAGMSIPHSFRPYLVFFLAKEEVRKNMLSG